MAPSSISMGQQVNDQAWDPRARAARRIWLSYWRAMRHYHRFEVSGFEHIMRPGAALIVGYHGRAGAHDLCMLQSYMFERTGAMGSAVMHHAFARMPVLRWLVAGGGFVTSDGGDLAEAVGKGERLFVTPGGTREGYRSARDRYRVDWGQRTGYLRLALKYGLPIIPTGASGVDDTFIGLNDGYKWGKRLGAPAGLPLWLGVGPLGLWPLSPPFPSKIRLRIGSPFQPTELFADCNEPSEAVLLTAHARVAGAVQALLNSARRA